MAQNDSEDDSKVSDLINKSFDKIARAFEFFPGPDRNWRLRQSFGFLQQAENEPDLSNDDKQDIYSLSSIVCRYLGELDKSIEYQNLTFAIEEDNYWAKIAQAFSLLDKIELSLDENSQDDASIDLLSDLQKDGADLRVFTDAAESFQRWHQDIDFDDPDFMEKKDAYLCTLHVGAFLLMDMACSMHDLSIKNEFILRVILSAPWDKFVNKSKNPDDIDVNVDDPEEDEINSIIEDFLAEIHCLLALNDIK